MTVLRGKTWGVASTLPCPTPYFLHIGGLESALVLETLALGVFVKVGNTGVIGKQEKVSMNLWGEDSDLLYFCSCGWVTDEQEGDNGKKTASNSTLE